MKKKKYKLLFLYNKSNNWIYNYLIKINFSKFRKFKIKHSYSFKDIKSHDIIFPLSCTKILPENIISKKLVIINHSSDLPRNKGFSPMHYQILKKKNIIPNVLFKAVNEVDAGPIISKDFIKLDGTELYDELRKKQSSSTIKLIKKFMKNYPNIRFKNQKKIKSNFNKRRFEKDSELDINLSIKKQFNLLRVCDNVNYPPFFYYKKKKYIINIFQNSN